MYNKTIWNPGDIITSEKWDNINNNLSILGAYQLSVTIEEIETTDVPRVKTAAGKPIEYTYICDITIHKSFNEIVKLLKQGVICWYYNNLDGTINYITGFKSDQLIYASVSDIIFTAEENEMKHYVKVPVTTDPAR